MRITLMKVFAALGLAMLVAQTACGPKARTTAAERLTATDRLIPSAPAVVGMDQKLGATLDTLAVRRGGAARDEVVMGRGWRATNRTRGDGG